MFMICHPPWLNADRLRAWPGPLEPPVVAHAPTTLGGRSSLVGPVVLELSLATFVSCSVFARACVSVCCAHMYW